MKKSALLFPAILAACGGYDPYVPEQAASGVLDGRTAAEYELPSELGTRGDVRLASYGISELRRQDGDQKIKAVHVRFAVTNRSTTPMTVDVRNQRVQLQDGTRISPVLATSPAGGIPVVNVPPASSRIIDLFFPLERYESKDRQPPRFDVVWRVEIANETVVEVTPFAQVEIDPVVAQQEAMRSAWAGPYWYFSPYWYGWGPFWGW